MPQAPGPQNPKPKISPRGSRGGRRCLHPAAGAIQGFSRPARGAFAPGPVEGRHSAAQKSSASLTSAACGARLELKPHWQNRNAALARPPREECEKHGASPCETSPCEPGFFSPAAPTTHHHHLHHTKTSRSWRFKVRIRGFAGAAKASSAAATGPIGASWAHPGAPGYTPARAAVLLCSGC